MNTEIQYSTKCLNPLYRSRENSLVTLAWRGELMYGRTTQNHSNLSVIMWLFPKHPDKPVYNEPNQNDKNWRQEERLKSEERRRRKEQEHQERPRVPKDPRP